MVNTIKSMKQTGFKIKFSSLRRTTGFKKSPFYSLKRSSFKKNSELTPKKKLDNIVSKCIRLAAADNQGIVQCVTCNKYFHWKNVDCGHFQKRGNTSTRYDPKNLGPQCKDCNRLRDGENDLFAEFIDKHHGEGTAEMLRAKAREIERYYPYEEEIEKWTQIYKQLVEKTSNEINY